MRLAGTLLASSLLLGMAGASNADVLPDGFVRLSRTDPRIKVEMHYFGPDNFLGRRVDGYTANECILTAPAASALSRVQDDLIHRGLGLKVFDCYRPARAVADFMKFASNEERGRKAEHFPNVDKSDFVRLGYVASKSSHSLGHAVDLTLIDAKTGRELDMGTGFDRFDDASHTASPLVSGLAAANRRTLAHAMERGGFKGYAKEWWHFGLKSGGLSTPLDFPVTAR